MIDPLNRGDFNIDLIKFDLNDNTNEYLNVVLKMALYKLSFCYESCMRTDRPYFLSI